VRGTPQVHTLGGLPVFVMPLLHPAAALRTPSLVETLRGDFAALRELAETPPPRETATEADETVAMAGVTADPDADQLDLFA
jgi:DNA polymerase